MRNNLFNLLYVCWLGVLTGLCFFSCVRNGDTRISDLLADSLNKVSFAYRYKDLSIAKESALRASELKSTNPTVRSQTLNNLGFCAFMEMDFEKAVECYEQVSKGTNNEIEGLVADVGMMKIYQRTSLNKEFFDYRNQALRRMKRIGADHTVLADSVLSGRYLYAMSEFHIVSGIYYYYLQQDKESLLSIDAISEQTLAEDRAQLLYYKYMKGSGGMYVAESPEKVVLGEFGYLLECLEMAHKFGYTYFEANSLQAMAEMLNFESNRRLLETERLGWMRMINPEEMPMDSLPLALANRALELFKQYGDWYQISGTYRTIATYYNYMDKPELALPNLEKALDYVNEHHAKFYACKDTTDRLYAYREDVPFSVELKWVNDEGILTVPEWVARLREQLSRTYSAMGMKRESDYNRNIYLDILDYTRQDKELESRYAALETESRQLNALLVLVGMGFTFLVVVFFYLNRFWKKRYSRYLDELRLVLNLCGKITAAVPTQAAHGNEVSDAVHKAVDEELLSLIGAEEWWIGWIDSTPEVPADGSCNVTDAEVRPLEVPDERVMYGDNQDIPDWLDEIYATSFDLVAPGKSQPVAKLWFRMRRAIKKDEQSLIQLILPYMAWTLENGLNLASLSDERLRLEKEQYIHWQHLVENKKQNEVKKTCLSIVTGIVPYIDRVVNEVHKLSSASFARDESVKRGKLNYVCELAGKINEYNDILAQWIKMRQGALSLNVENFSLGDLFKVIAKGKRTFDLKQLCLTVRDTEAVVKADKALTLFMINTLTENARKYTPSGGKVEVYAEETADYVEISVKDTGPGLSEKDVTCILSEKVYDSGNIGLDTARDVDELQKQKGHGFGLMNCKGIIDKYQKTNALFNVCVFSIESELGKGSRFFFRLPKGIRRGLQMALLPILLVLNVVLSSTGVMAAEGREVDVCEAPDESVFEDVQSYDSLLAVANYFANQVYDCNVNGAYEKALVLADSVLYYMNQHFLKYSYYKAPLLTVGGKGEAGELTWLANDFDTDYFILLDVRNEIAVACLAIKDFKRYYYNNSAYTALYKQLSEDNSLEEYCVQMQRSANNKTVALTLFILMILSCLVAYYLLYWRRRLHYRYNMEQVFSINRAAFSATAVPGKESREVREGLVEAIFNEVNELVPIDNLVLAVKEEGQDDLRFSLYQSEEEDLLEERIKWCFERQETEGGSDSVWYCLPLSVQAGADDYHVGVLALKWSQPALHEEDMLLVKLIGSSLAVVLYNSIVQVERKYLDIELAQDEARRALFEENMLHVQNLVLDNCLSTIKHETIYYPNRIRQIAERLMKQKEESETSLCPTENAEQLADMSELVSYYKDVFTLLAQCAARQLDEVTFRRSEVRVATVVVSLRKYYKKITRKMRVYPELLVEAADLSVVGDEILLNFLFENLLNEVVQYEAPGQVLLKVSEEEDFVRFDFTDFRRNFPQDELNALFYPDHVRISQIGGTSVVKGTEYLVCKQIIREHDEYGGRRGCRINACPTSDGQGFTVWFTIPKYKERI